MRKLHRYDKLLFAALLVLNIGSGVTTIMGATQIFPLGIGVFSGFAIQMMLFLLLSRLAVRDTPVRKWLAVLVFASLSIYTSFFAYYGTLTESTRAERLYDRAVAAHQKLVADVYTPIETNLNQLQSQAIRFKNQKEEEIQGNGIPGNEGFGNKARDLADKARAAEDEVAALKPLVDKLNPLFNYKTTGMTPEKILERDRIALGSVPEKHLPDHYRINQLQRSDYIEAASAIRLLEPFLKIQGKDPSAVASLTIAMLIDGMIILLGTAIEVRRQNIPFETQSHFIAVVITGAKSSWATILKALRQPALPFETARADESDRLRRGVKLVTLRLKGRGSAFLEEFYNAISAETGLIDYERLRDNPNTTFSIGYRILLDALRNPRLRWIETMNRQWYITEDHYAPLVSWLCQELIYQCEQEERHEASEEFFASTRNVPIRIPSGF